MEIKYSDNVVLKINITDKMIETGKIIVNRQA